MLDGGLILVVVAVLVVVGLAVGLFTSYGSGITPRPWRGGGGTGAPGAKGPEEVSGRDEGEHSPMQHGTRRRPVTATHGPADAMTEPARDLGTGRGGERSSVSNGRASDGTTYI